MVSPFDLAASHPTMGGSSKKKLPSFSSVPNIVISNTEMAPFSSSSGQFSPPPGEVVTVTFSSPANMEAFQAFDCIDVENQSAGAGGAWVEKGGNIFLPPSSPSSSTTGALGLENFYRPPKLDSSERRLSDVSMGGSTAATSVASSLRRLSWQSIESFDESHSGMESLVSSMHFREERKNRAFKFLGVTMILAVCYVLASFFASEDLDDSTTDSIPMDQVRAVIPKFLDPFHGPFDSDASP